MKAPSFYQSLHFSTTFKYRTLYVPICRDGSRFGPPNCYLFPIFVFPLAQVLAPATTQCAVPVYPCGDQCIPIINTTPLSWLKVDVSRLSSTLLMLTRFWSPQRTRLSDYILFFHSALHSASHHWLSWKMSRWNSVAGRTVDIAYHLCVWPSTP